MSTDNAEQSGVGVNDDNVCVSSLAPPGLLAVEQTKSALRGRRSSCRVMEPLEADMSAGSGAARPFFWAVGSPFRRSSSAFSASLLSARSIERRRGGIQVCNCYPGQQTLL